MGHKRTTPFRFNNRKASHTTPPEQKPLTTEELMRVIRNQAIFQLEGTPPHSPMQPCEVEYDMGYTNRARRSHRGQTKREYAALEILKQFVAAQGSHLLSEEMMQSMCRQALILSEHFYRILDIQRREDIQQFMDGIEEKARKAAKESEGDADVPKEPVLTMRTIDDDAEEKTDDDPHQT